MLKLTARIRVQRLFGSLEKVASEGSGGPLQAKTAWPSHDEQVIAPDEDYYGLVSVKVMPVPRLPACVASARGQSPNVVGAAVNIWAETSLQGSEFVQTHALYGNFRLPLIPEDLLAQYPYAFIYRDVDEDFYRLMLSTGIWWYKTDGGDYSLVPVVTETRPVYKANLDSAEWEFCENHSEKSIYMAYYNVAYAYTYWTNFNIPNGSATSTSYYLRAKEPGLTL